MEELGHQLQEEAADIGNETIYKKHKKLRKKRSTHGNKKVINTSESTSVPTTKVIKLAERQVQGFQHQPQAAATGTNQFIRGKKNIAQKQKHT
jgi:hypothetical protein